MAKLKNPFKKKSLIDTLTNTAIGGAGNVAFDYIWSMANLDTTLASEDGKRDVSLIKNAIKLVGGAVAGSMVSNKYLHAMTDGFAVVGASDLVSGLINGMDIEEDSSSNTAKTDGLPENTIGKIRRHYGSPIYARKTRSTRGTNGLEGFME